MPDAFQLQGSASKIYEEQKVPAIFRPLAEATLKQFTISPDDSVLDVACGTGVLARVVREMAGPSVRVAGVDLNAGMIETAREITGGMEPPIRWEVASAAEMPFADGEFSALLCQQGIQFFPDDQTAVEEMRRVLKPGGRLGITVWAGVSPFFQALADAIERHVSPEAAKQSLAPFSYDGATRLPPILEEARFESISVLPVTIDRTIGDPAADIEKEILGNPVGPKVADKGPGTMAAIVGEVIDACASYRQNNSLIVPQTASLITASAA